MRLYSGSVKALFRGSVKALLRLYSGSVKALFMRAAQVRQVRLVVKMALGLAEFATCLAADMLTSC